MPSRPPTDPRIGVGERIVPRDHPEYPTGLRALRDPPVSLFVRGGALPRTELGIAVVGSRAATPYGLSLASRLAGDLARMGFVVVSGLARGVDAAAHRGALGAGGRTVAVLPGGLDAITPRHHRDLADAIAGAGALVTERAAGGPRFRGEFVRRNRLIAALAAATVVVEAGARSGSLSTAAVARRLGRPVLAVPGDVDRETSHGCHRLIRAGALLCERAHDVAGAAWRWAGGAPGAAPPLGGAARGASADPPGPEARLLAVLGVAPLTVEALAAAAELSVPETLSGLLSLQWSGDAVPHPGQRWARTVG